MAKKWARLVKHLKSKLNQGNCVEKFSILTVENVEKNMLKDVLFNFELALNVKIRQWRLKAWLRRVSALRTGSGNET